MAIYYIASSILRFQKIGLRFFLAPFSQTLPIVFLLLILRKIWMTTDYPKKFKL